MDEQLDQVSAATGVPSDLLSRAAASRAKALGIETAALVASWAGAEAPAPAVAPPPAAEAAEPPPAEQAPTPEAAPVADSPRVEVLEPLQAPAEPEDETHEEEPAPTGLLSSFPAWLGAAFVILPSIAILYALLTPNAPPCGTAGQLAIDPVNGAAVNCDGTAYGVEIVNLFTIGRDTYSARCVACHAADGSGGAGPALRGGAVLATFNEGNCSSHIEWVTLGTAGWPAVNGNTYGDNNKPVGGSGAQMPGFDGQLTADEIQSVVLYERVAFGGQALPDAEIDCGATEGDVVAAP